MDYIGFGVVGHRVKGQVFDVLVAVCSECRIESI